MEDKQLKSPRVWEMIAEENHAQIEKWGVQNHHPYAWLAFLTEEVGELAEAMTEADFRGGRKQDVVKEAIQVATLSMKIAEMFGA